MGLKETLRTDMTTAMKAREQETVAVLRMALASISNAEVAGDEARTLDETEVLRILQKEVASRKDSAEAYTSGNRPELAAKELAEVEILQRYLPADLTPEELDAIVAEEIANVAGDQEPSMKLMGQVIKAVNARAAGRAEGAVVAAKVKAALLG